MHTRQPAKRTAVVAIAVLLATLVTPAAAAPVPSSTALVNSAATSNLSEVRWRGRGGGGVAAGIAAGLLLGGIIASSPYRYGGPSYYYGPPSYYPPGYYGPVYGPRYLGPPDWMSYCFSRYRSFDPATGTYMGYDGRRHLCR